MRSKDIAEESIITPVDQSPTATVERMHDKMMGAALFLSGDQLRDLGIDPETETITYEVEDGVLRVRPVE